MNAGNSMLWGLSANQTIFSTGVYTGVANTIGLCKESADSDLFWIATNGAGATLKTDLGIAAASIQGHLLDLSINCTQGGIQMTLTDYDNNSKQYSYSIASGATNLPATNVPLYFVNTLYTNADNSNTATIYAKRWVGLKGFGT